MIGATAMPSAATATSAKNKSVADAVDQ